MFDFILNYDFMFLLEPATILGLIAGSVFGMMVGALPGLSATVGCALLLPVTFTLEPRASIVMMAAVFMSSQYGGSISAIVLGIPGTPAAVATVFDGYALSKKGFPGKALGYSLYSSTFAGFFGVAALMLLTGPLAEFALRLSDPELFLIGMMGLLSVVSLGEKDIWKTVISLFLGLAVGTIGIDPFTGAHRYTFGNIYLGNGILLVALLSGFYALSEVLEMCTGNMTRTVVTDTKNLKCHISWQEFKDILPVCVRGGIIGTICGIIPGLGGGPASFFSYTQAKAVDREPETFGQGNPRGIASCEGSNNAVVGGGLIPFLSLGIPGTPTIAVMAGALMVQGIDPGPQLMKENPALVYTVYWGLFFSVIAMFLLGRYTTSLFARILKCPGYVLMPVIIMLTLIGAYVGRGFWIDVWIAIGAGVLAFIMKRLDFSMNAFALSFVLADLIEDRFRRSLMLSKGDPVIFFNRPFCILIWLMIAYMIYVSIKNNNKLKQAGNLN
ncbi:MAG: tripartite tricarboxylate transporter permease [Methylobacteriaceae bacterium]|jgi:putative tricarboxylic transport membrane protein|nr:tripartite tricarboxylate transporter permease [Methylobacteriaceae bacterium]